MVDSPIPDSPLFGTSDITGGLDITGMITGMIPDIVKAGVNYAGTAVQNSGLDNAKDRYVDTSNAAAATLDKGYDQSLDLYKTGTNDLYNILDEGNVAQRGELTGGMQDYAGITRDATSNYGATLQPEYANYSGMLTDSAQNSGDLYQTGADEVSGAYDPYVNTGAEAMAYLTQAMNTDPSTRTPSQQLAIDNYHRDALARLANSGLRGAGRAGVAAVNQGEAAMDAQFYDQNQKRADAAANTLNSQGYSATGTSAGAQAGAKNAQAGIVLNTGAKIADQGMAAAKDIADKNLAGEQNIATQGLNTATNLSNLAGQYTSNKGNLSAGLTNAAVDVTKGKAVADATATGNIGNITYNTMNKQADNVGDALAPASANMYAAITDDAKKAAAKNAAAQG